MTRRGQTVDRAEREAVERRLRIRVAASSGAGTAAILAAVLLLVFWEGHQQRFWLLMACFGIAASGIAVLVVQRARTPELTPDDAVRLVLDQPVPGNSPHPDAARPDAVPPLPTALPRLHGRRRLRLVTLAVSLWISCGFLLAMADTEAPPEVRELKEAGAVLGTLTVTQARSTTEWTGSARMNKDRIYRQDLEFDMPGAEPDAAGVLPTLRTTVVVRTRHSVGDRLPVIYVPDKPGIEPLAGPSRDSLAGDTENYSADIERLFNERALSGRQLGFGAVVWLLVWGLCWAGVRSQLARPGKYRLPGSRALRGAFRSGRFEGAGRSMRFKGPEPAFSTVRKSLEGRTGWICWDARKAKKRRRNKTKTQTARGWLECPAVVVLDSGHAVCGYVEFLEPPYPGEFGVEAGGEHAPLDKSRQVRMWAPHRTWPLTMDWHVPIGLGLAALLSALLFTTLVPGFFPRLVVGLLASAALIYALGGRFEPDSDTF